MTPQELAKLANALVTLYIQSYKKKIGTKPVDVNRYRAKYGFQDMISDLGFDRSKEVIKFYFEGRRPAFRVNDLLYSYERLDQLMTELEEDEANRKKLREETKKRVEEWEARNG